MKKTGIIIGAAIIAIITGGTYFVMGSKKSSNNVNEEYSRGHRVVMSSINPVPSELKENYFGGKQTKKRKRIKKNKTKKR
jgi:hypothetical protein